MNQTLRHRHWQTGVGLVEIAIALVVIGILIGAVLQGKHLIDQARLNAVITDVQKVRLNVQRFKEKHGFLPGDFPYASRDIQSDLPNGDGKGILNGNPFSIDSSAGRFWVHLNAANGSVVSSTSILNYGDGLMACGFGGGYTVISNPIESMPGHWVVLGSKANDASGEGVLLTPEQAQYIDKKLDNGSPSTGTIRSLDVNRQTTGKCIKEGRYNLSNSDKACVIYFSIDE
ncbi:MAG: hypothetical protein Q8Q56_03375 [Alphaproteobacteria bacterium]|nr:hypothetical protein [Alphaproteobacteria bacterium]